VRALLARLRRDPLVARGRPGFRFRRARASSPGSNVLRKEFEVGLPWRDPRVDCPDGAASLHSSGPMRCADREPSTFELPAESLKKPAMSDETHPIILARPGESPESLAREMSRHSELSFDDSITTLCDNNRMSQGLPHCGGRPLWVRPEPLQANACSVWEEDRRQIEYAFAPAPLARGVAQQDPWLLTKMYDFAESAAQNRWAIGKQVSQLAGFGSTGVSAVSGVLQRELQGIAQLADRVYSDVMVRFSASRSPFGVSNAERGALEQMLKSHPEYGQLRRALDALPRFLQRRLGNIHLPSSPIPNADFFRRQFVVPMGVQPGVYLGRVANRLGGQVLRAGSYARRATWYVPAILGVYNTLTAPEGKKLRTGAGETVGVVLGALGSSAGGFAATATAGWLATAGVVILPGGVVFVAAVAASAVVGYAGYTGGTWLGESLYDTLSETIGAWADAWVEIF